MCYDLISLLIILFCFQISLSKVRYLVLDEADRLLDLGFEPEIRRLIERPELPAKELRQTLMFSATFPMVLQELARNYMHKTYALVAIDLIGSANKCITQEFVEVGHIENFSIDTCILLLIIGGK